MRTTASQIAPQDTGDALGMMHVALDHLASADLRALGTEQQARALRELASISAQMSAMQGAVLAVFDAAGGPEQAGCQSAVTLLVRNAQATKGAARTQLRWSRTQQAHPVVAAVMGSGDLSESFARQITDWTSKLPEDMQAQSDNPGRGGGRGVRGPGTAADHEPDLGAVQAGPGPTRTGTNRLRTAACTCRP